VRQLCASDKSNHVDFLRMSVDFHGLAEEVLRLAERSSRPQHAPQKRATSGDPLSVSGGERFEPSIRLSTDDGFRGRFEPGDLQGLLVVVRQNVRQPARRQPIAPSIPQQVRSGAVRWMRRFRL